VIYLWTTGQGWTEHEITDIDELSKRDITVGARARVGDGAWVGDGATVGDGASPIIIYIIGSRHPLSYWGEDRIDIGCHQYSIRLWQENGHAIGEQEGYTPEQIEEYGRYINIIAAQHAANPDSAKAKTE